MSLNADEVQRAYLLTAGRNIENAQAEQTARLLGSRDELLAVLLLRDRVLDCWPELAAEIMALAKGAYVKPATVRTELGDLMLRERVNRETTKAVEQLIISEIERKPLTDSVHAALRRNFSNGRELGEHPGYQYCVDCETDP